MKALLVAGALLLPAADTAVLPQVINSGGLSVPSLGALLINTDGSPITAAKPLPTMALAVQETLQLALANAAGAPVTAYGGSYIFSQTCAGYGSLALQVLGPDGATWQTVATDTASDTAGGSALSLGSNATVRVTLSGTTGCAATLSRVPA